MKSNSFLPFLEMYVPNILWNIMIYVLTVSFLFQYLFIYLSLILKDSCTNLINVKMLIVGIMFNYSLVLYYILPIINIIIRLIIMIQHYKNGNTIMYDLNVR